MSLAREEVAQSFGVILQQRLNIYSVWPRENLCDVIDERQQGLQSKFVQSAMNHNSDSLGALGQAWLYGRRLFLVKKARFLTNDNAKNGFKYFMIALVAQFIAISMDVSDFGLSLVIKGVYLHGNVTTARLEQSCEFYEKSEQFMLHNLSR